MESQSQNSELGRLLFYDLFSVYLRQLSIQT